MVLGTSRHTHAQSSTSAPTSIIVFGSRLFLYFQNALPNSMPCVKFNPDTNIPDLTGQVIIVTGGNAGLGLETIRELAKHNPIRIYLAARSKDKAHPPSKSSRREQARNYPSLSSSSTYHPSQASKSPPQPSRATHLV